MLEWLFKPKQPKQPKVWALQSWETRIWNKVVSYDTPVPFHPHHLQGPFRSEMDCEEFCDHQNKGLAGYVLFYGQVPAPKETE